MPTSTNGSSELNDESAFRPIVVGALYPDVERGLAADLVAVRSLGGLAYPVCTLLLMAGHGTVTDSTDVPEDTVRAQLEHIVATVKPNAMKIGVLSSHLAADTVLRFAETFAGPVLFDLQLSGPSGETVLTPRAIDAVMEKLSVPDLVVLSRSDAEPISGGEIRSLDDAQVAAQRLVRRGARSVLIKCGPLPSRFFETDQPLPPSDTPFNADLYFDGDEFSLFEAPHLLHGNIDGASSAFSVVTLRALAAGMPIEEALQAAKRFTTEGLRTSTGVGGDGLFNYFWQSHEPL